MQIGSERIEPGKNSRSLLCLGFSRKVFKISRGGLVSGDFSAQCNAQAITNGVNVKVKSNMIASSLASVYPRVLISLDLIFSRSLEKIKLRQTSERRSLTSVMPPPRRQQEGRINVAREKKTKQPLLVD